MHPPRPPSSFLTSRSLLASHVHVPFPTARCPSTTQTLYDSMFRRHVLLTYPSPSRLFPPG
ncbi:hypothetical protein E2C01_054955 [Portunus trituberculatus]|uniref:Uncharacterized protein n=1 Tax=Portunus trituberculatus TaxID=210409 RepID=A0A5B7GTK1_PORTR|nr:hypothetical protein [Portunus trituberculatus]